MRNLHIAHISPPDLLTPPAGYGGTERIAAYLTNELVNLGCTVDLYAPLGSQTKGNLIPTTPRALRDIDICKDIETRNRMREQIVQMAVHRAVRSDADVILNQVPQAIPHYESLKLRLPYVPPMVTVVHNPLDSGKEGGHFTEYYGRYPLHPLITISSGQRMQELKLNHFATIHHGIDEREFPFGEGKGGYLLFLARMAREKGPHRAIEIAKRANMPLILAGTPDSDHQKYFDEEVMPQVDGEKIKYVGEVAGEEKQKLLANASALLAPLEHWPEPFGLYFAEAMLSGTPVITKRNRYSSTGEVVNDGVGGYVVDTMDEFVEAVRKIPLIDRNEVRTWALSRFTKSRMAEEYKDALTFLYLQSIALSPAALGMHKEKNQ